MTFIKAQKPLTLVIFPEPTVADPAWLIPVAEISEPWSESNRHLTPVAPKELINLLINIEVKSAAYAAEEKGRNEILTLFNISAEEYFKKRSERRNALKGKYDTR